MKTKKTKRKSKTKQQAKLDLAGGTSSIPSPDAKRELVMGRILLVAPRARDSESGRTSYAHAKKYLKELEQLKERGPAVT